MNKRRWYLVSLLCLLIIFSAVGCSKDDENTDSSNEGEVTEVTLWHMEEPPNRVEGFKKVIEKFNEENPDIQIKPQVQSWDDAYTKIPAAIQSGNGPELLFTLPDYTTLINELGVVQPVDDIVAELDEKYNFIESSLAPYQYNDHTWAVPIFSMIQVLWYRADLFEEANLEPPTNWEELTHAAEVLTKDDVYGIALPASKSLATDQVLYSFMVSAGAKDIIDGDDNITFDTPETVKAYEKYVELLEYSPVDSNTYTWGEPQAQFNSGKAAMAIEKGQYLAPFEEESGLPAEKLGVVPMPVADSGEHGSIHHSNGIMVLTDDEKKREAIKSFFEFLYEPKNYVEFINAEPGLFLPVTEEASLSSEYWENPFIAKYENQVNVLIDATKDGYLFGFTDGVSENVGKISGPNILAQTLEQIISNGMTPEEAVKNGQEMMEEAIK